MVAIITRDSVCAGDDYGARKPGRFRLSDDWSWEELVDGAWRFGELPLHIAGGKATWVLASGIPLGAGAQQWECPRLLWLLERDREGLDLVGDFVRLHWSYMAQIDPDITYDVLRRLQLRSDAKVPSGGMLR